MHYVYRLRAAILHIFLNKSTGDLTDAKLPDRTGSQQYEQEWQIYDNIIRETGITNKTVWLDIRGNHGMFSNRIHLVIQCLLKVYSKQIHTSTFCRCVQCSSRTFP